MYTDVLKRTFDLVVAIILIVLFSPFIFLTFCLLCFVNKGKPMFIQERPGKNEKIFKLIKFKTMTDQEDEDGNLLPDYLRLTKFGNFIRKTSLDEFPQFINVIKGDMSFIGPRPLLVDYLELYSEKQKKRHDIRPGITGWAQVNGRNLLSWKQKFEFDVWYVENLSFKLDVKIIFKTIVKTFISEGISASGSATAEKFTGNN